MPSFTALLSLAALATTVLGHGHVRRIVANGVTYPGYERWSNADQSNTVSWQFSTEDEGPISVASLNSPDIICSQNAVNAPASIPIAAGSQLQVVRFNTIGGYEHPGPEIHYLASCGDAGCSQVDKHGLQFFKFYESGLVQGGVADSPQWNSQKWATTEVHKSVQPEGDGFVDTYTVTIPQNIRPGSYVLRHEVLGLHKAHEGQAEFYPQCINLEISGSGNELPQGIPATELYHSSDPGVAINIWGDLQYYQIPGPAVAGFSAKRGLGSKRHARDIQH
ncbi:lytic polysaccharide monooxygenase [Durotheca rogersii]|uniref:lytic polysaccharide monooxygenase n=1 Tax=Durotheca rogersii TaxID=419775 RepID=UPI00221E9DA0|nr:lytic polysaccharide monooxygenase [Durotheca rogersii]KAI5862028.1 lytic polysaccharide monooxygenase [Durotheca rogersii]